MNITFDSAIDLAFFITHSLITDEDRKEQLMYDGCLANKVNKKGYTINVKHSEIYTVK